MARALTPEILDHLPAGDPRAIASRRDLVRINRLMLQDVILARALAEYPGPATLVDVGGGDGHFLLRVARRLAGRWRGVHAVIVERQDIVNATTRTGFADLGWTCESVSGDVFGTWPTADIVIANLFLHHFDDKALARLLALIAGRSTAFVACEPRRSRFALLGAHLVGLIGANDVTRHDAVASVRAGFAGTELSALWPRQGWHLHEAGAFPFSHVFSAHAV